MKLYLVKCFLHVSIATLIFEVTCCSGITEVENVEMQLEKFNSEFENMWWLHQSADWSYSTNVTTDTAEGRAFAFEIYSDWMRKWKLWARRMDSEFLPASVKETVDMIASGIVIMSAQDARLISELRSQMTKMYSSANISVPLLHIFAQGEKEFGSMMAKVRDPAVLKTVWNVWRVQVGEKVRPLFLNLVKLLNKAAQENGYENLADSWRGELGFQDVLEVSLSLWEEVKPFYAHLHAYTHHKLKSVYNEECFSNSNLIPSHLLGSLWGENWVALNDVLTPYPEKNRTADFISKKYSVRDLIKKAETFYTTAGLEKMEPSFWKHSMFEKPKDGRLVDCHAVSYDFALNRDFRIRMCGEVTEQSLLEAIHEMGHVQYYMAYHHLPMLYRNGANSAFHEAVGETMVYAAQSSRCQNLMKIAKPLKVSREIILNSLMKQALSKFVLLPWALTLETWRYMLFSGEISGENMNEKWWELRKKFQGVEPPDSGSAKLFDAGTKYHVINNIPYIRYFISRFLEHQFLESLCDTAGENIHSCCFIKSKVAGRRLKKMLALGSSVSWQDALKTLTGQNQLSARPLIRYYQPLYIWLVEYNRRHNITAAW